MGLDNNTKNNYYGVSFPVVGSKNVSFWSLPPCKTDASLEIFRKYFHNFFTKADNAEVEKKTLRVYGHSFHVDMIFQRWKSDMKEY